MLSNIQETLNQALAYHQAGRYHEARGLYSQILEQHPNHPEALHLFGVLAYQVGSPQTAVDLIERAIALRAGVPTFHNSLGTALSLLGRFEEASQQFEQALVLNPTFEDALINLGNALQAQGKLGEALQRLQEAVRLSPKRPEARNNLGNVLKDLGKLLEAETCYREAILLEPQYVEAYYNLSCVLQDLEKPLEALNWVEQALTLNPDFIEAHLQAGIAQESLGYHEAAISCYRKVLALDPSVIEAYNNLGNVLQGLGRLDEAFEVFQQGLALQPQHPQSHYNLGVFYQRKGAFAQARECYEKTLQLKPDFAQAYYNLGHMAQQQREMDRAMRLFQQAVETDPEAISVYNDMGDTCFLEGKAAEARHYYQLACQKKPEELLWQLRAETLCPVMMSGSANEILQIRRRIEAGVERALAGPVPDFSLEALLNLEYGPSYYLPYHGCDDRAIKSKYGDFFQRALLQRYPELMEPVKPSRGTKPHLGFLATAGHEKGLGLLLGGILDHLSREDFRISICCGPDGVKLLQAYLKNTSGIDWVVMPKTLEQAVQTLKAQAFDLLWHYEVGSDPMNYFLPFFRSAAVQCTSFGYPITTGIPGMDYFLSSTLWEPPDGERYYREQLVRFDTLPLYYYLPLTPATFKTRQELGLPDDVRLYACPQSLFKFHPDMDTVFRSILDQDPTGRIVLVEGAFPHWKTLLQERFKRNLPAVADRIQFLPRLKPYDFLNLLAVSDVALDPVHYGGGNTSLETLHLGTPLITLPSPYLRCRLTDGFYRKMGISDCTVASLEEYSQKALQIAGDVEYRRGLQEKILVTKSVLFEDPQSIQELSQFFHQAVEQSRL